MMNYLGKARNIPQEKRPLIDCNGIVQHMDDTQYGEYLQIQAELEQMPPSEPTTEERIAVLQKQVDDLILLLSNQHGNGTSV